MNFQSREGQRHMQISKFRFRLLNFFFSTLLVVGLSGLASAQQLEFWDLPKSDGFLPNQGQGATVATYNVENLFDTKHDEGKDDYARLPLSFKRANPQLMREVCERQSNPYWKKECYELDWSETVVRQKIQNIGRAVREMHQGRGPDILVVEEVENINVLTQLRDEALHDMGYISVVLIEGPDRRGIDIGILSRFPLIDAQLHLVDLDGPSPRPLALSFEEALRPEWTEAAEYYLSSAAKRVTRGILEATFDVRGRQLTVFGNHWPSQGAPTEQRSRAAWTLYQAASRAYDRGRDVIALGDFNTLENENPHPFRTWLMNPNLPLQFMDARDEFLRRYGPERLAPGSHYYRGSWSYLDRIFVLKQSLGAPMEREWEKFGVHAPEFLLQDNQRGSRPKDSMPDLFGNLFDVKLIPPNKIPMRFDPVQKTGFSDHLGLVGTLPY